MKAEEDHLAARSLSRGGDREGTGLPSRLVSARLGDAGGTRLRLQSNRRDRAGARSCACSRAHRGQRWRRRGARAKQAMMDAQFSSGSIERMRSSPGRKRLTWQPLCDPGHPWRPISAARYVQLNRPAEGCSLLQRADPLDLEAAAGRPWYDFFAFLGAHSDGCHQAVRYMRRSSSPTRPVQPARPRPAALPERAMRRPPRRHRCVAAVFIAETGLWPGRPALPRPQGLFPRRSPTGSSRISGSQPAALSPGRRAER